MYIDQIRQVMQFHRFPFFFFSVLSWIFLSVPANAQQQAVCTVNVSSSITTLNSQITSLQNEISPFVAPVTPVLGPSIFEFWGDSITAGSFGLSSPTTQRWSYLVSKQFGVTELNNGVSGFLWSNCLPHMYSIGRNRNSVVFLALGVNDVGQASTSMSVQETLYAAESTIWYSTLPASAFANKPSWIKSNMGGLTPAWAAIPDPQYGNIGYGTSQVGDTVTANVTGRFIVIASTVNYDPTLSTTKYGTISITVDGNPILVNQAQVAFTPTKTESGFQGYPVFTYVIDTQNSSTSNHSVSFTIGTPLGGFSALQFIDWIAGFSYNTSFSPVVLLSIYRYQTDNGGNGYTAPGGAMVTSQIERTVLNEEYRLLVTRMREEYNLPLYFVQDAAGYDPAKLSPDTLHPNPYGHQYIANRVTRVLQKGEFPFLSAGLM